MMVQQMLDLIGDLRNLPKNFVRASPWTMKFLALPLRDFWIKEPHKRELYDYIVPPDIFAQRWCAV